MKWDSKLYDEKHSFVSEYGKGLLEFVPVDQTRRILDIGCGTGVLTEKLSKQCGYVLGTDSSAEMIEKANEQVPCHRFCSSRCTKYPLYKRMGYRLFKCRISLDFRPRPIA